MGTGNQIQTVTQLAEYLLLGGVDVLESNFGEPSHQPHAESGSTRWRLDEGKIYVRLPCLLAMATVMHGTDGMARESRMAY